MTQTKLIAKRLITLLVLLAGAAHAQTIATNMKIDGLLGDSVLLGHENEIVLTGYSQTIGTKICSRVVVTKLIDRSSPGLVSRTAGNVTTPQVIITLSKLGVGPGPLDFFRVTLDQVTFERLELGEQTDQLMERVVMAPRLIRIEYRTQLSNGSLGPPITSSIAC